MGENVVTGVTFSDTSDKINTIINNSTIKELIPDIKSSDIVLYNGMLILNVKRGEETVEAFRIDVINEDVFIQAPLSHIYSDIFAENPIYYKYASVNVSSKIGKEILKNENYTIRLIDLQPSKSILRETQDAV